MMGFQAVDSAPLVSGERVHKPETLLTLSLSYSLISKSTCRKILKKNVY